MISFYRLLLFFVFLGTSCAVWGGNKLVYSDQEVISNKLIAHVAKHLAETYDLKPVGFGGAIHEEVEKLSLSFNCYRILTVGEYRDLIVHCAEYFLSEINSDSELKPYLQNYPFKAENIDLAIFVYSENKKQLDVGHLSCVHLIRGKISYSYRNTEYTVDSSKREDYEEAKKIVFSSDNKGEISL